MKRNNGILYVMLICILIFNVFPEAAADSNTVQRTIYVSPKGSDESDGTEKQPYRTLEKARNEIRKINSDMSGDILVILDDGVYYLEQPLELTEQDSGSNGYKIIYKAAPGKQPILSGGRALPAMQKAEGELWRTKVEGIEQIRELSINGRRARRASSETKQTALGDYDDPNTDYENDGLIMDASVVGAWENPQDVTFNWCFTWVYNQMKVKDIFTDPTDKTRTIVTFQQPYWQYVKTRPAQAKAGTMCQYSDAFVIDNAFELLDTPGEFYFNRTTKYLYYWPLENESMEDALVEAPVLDTIINIHGSDIENHIHDVEFQGITMRGATWQSMNENSFCGEQAQTFATSEINAYPPGAVQLNYASRINFTDCIINNTASTGFDLGEGVCDSNFTGNAIFDIGGSAFSVGRRWHAYLREPEYPEGPQEVLQKKPLSSSSMKSQEFRAKMARDTLFEHPAPKSNPNYYFQSHSDDKRQGICSWLKADLMKPYNIDKIDLVYGSYAFNGPLDEEGRRNFEVIASNDPNFTTYDVLHTQSNDSSPEILSVKGNGNKYRYLMIRKTQPGTLIVGELYVYSYDEKAIRVDDICRNITINNNYMDRCASYYFCMPTVSATYVDTLKVEHNDIMNSPYSGVSLGWGWSATNTSTTCRNNSVSYNLINGVNMECHDGGCIYTLGQMPDTILEGNYLVNQIKPFGSLYTDEGSAYLTLRNNVAEYTPASIFTWIATDHDIMAYDNYSETTRFINEGTNCNIETPVNYIPGRPTPEAKKIIDNAGLEPRYQHLRKYADVNSKTYGRGRDLYASAVSAFGTGFYEAVTQYYLPSAEQILQNAPFGNLPGQFSPYAKLELQNAVDEVRLSKRTSDGELLDQVDAKMRLYKALTGVKETLYDLPLDQLIDFCRKYAEQAMEGEKLDQYSRESIDTFIAEIAQAELDSKQSEKDLYQILFTLESALHKFYNSAAHADILALEVNGTRADIDQENRKITVELPVGTDLKESNIKLIVSEGAKVYTDLKDETDLRYPRQIALGVRDQIRLYTLEASVSQGNSLQSFSKNAEQWYNADNIIPVEINGKLRLSDSYAPYMMKNTLFDDRIDVSFTTALNLDSQPISLMFGAKSAEVLNNGKDETSDHFRLELKGKTAILYQIHSGVTKQIATATISPLQPLQDCRLLVEIQDGAVCITLNDNVIINSHVGKLNGGYVGFYLPNTSIILN